MFDYRKKILTYRISLLSSKGKINKNFGLFDIIGADYKNFSKYSFMYIDIDKGNLCMDIPKLLREISFNKMKMGDKT